MTEDIPDPVDLNRPLLRGLDWSCPWKELEYGDVLDYVAATVQNGAERRPRDGCWSGRYTYEEIRGGWWS